MTHEVVLSALALDDLHDIHDFIAERAGDEIADSCLARIEGACRTLQQFPHRGTPRDDPVRGLRTLAFERQAVIGSIVEGRTVTILRVLYGGRDLAGPFDPP